MHLRCKATIDTRPQTIVLISHVSGQSIPRRHQIGRNLHGASNYAVHGKVQPGVRLGVVQRARRNLGWTERLPLKNKEPEGK